MTKFQKLVAKWRADEEFGKERGRLALSDDDDRLLIANAIANTRVSHFTKQQRARLTVLLTYIGFKLEGGL